jgi:DNA segregation ATPase FtsK/SpoIIIE-like protein
VPREEPPPPEVALPEDEHPQGPGDSGEPEQDRFALPPEELRTMSGRLDDVLTSYSLPLQPVQPSDAVCGPNTVRFRVRMARGGTIAQVEARERDIMRELGLQKEIMVGQEAGFVTLDVPRASPVTVRFRDIAPALDARPRVRGELPVAFGVDLSGSPQIKDLAQLPHLLVAGTTGSGKSVFLSSILASLAKLPPDELQILLVDVKGLDFAPYASLPHLRQPPIGDAEQALEVLEELYETERSKRRNVLAGAGAQSILDYYTRLEQRDLPQIVIVVDEFSNLLSGDKATGSRLEDIVQQYAEIMRSFGVYLVIATQRPSADIVTGRIKANLPARCALYLPTHADSMTILGRRGAEQLLGNGDMLFYREGSIERLQVPFTGPQDVLGAAGL